MSAIAAMLAQTVKPLHRCVRHDTEDDRKAYRKQYWRDYHAKRQSDPEYRARKHQAVRRARGIA